MEMSLQESTHWQVSPSQLSAHKECSQKWFYNYGLSLRPLGQEVYFAVGSYFHELAHFYYELIKSGMTIGSKPLRAAMQSKMEEDLKNAAPEWKHVYIKVHIMFHRYLEHRTEVLDKDINVLSVEETLSYEILPGVNVMGILDLAYEQKGKLIIRDHKTGENKSAHSDSKMELYRIPSTREQRR